MTGGVRDRIRGCNALDAFLCAVLRFALTLLNFARYRFPTGDNAWIREPKPAAGLPSSLFC